MLHLILGGGLGNQMFQYAYARTLQLEYNVQVKFNTFLYRNKVNKDREFALENLNISKDILMGDKLSDYKNYEIFSQKIKWFRWANKININKSNLLYKFMNYRGLYSPLAGQYKYFSSVYNSENDGYIHGGFQSWKYFEKYKDVIKKELEVCTPPSIKNKKMLNEIILNNSVCVHIRRGDYLDKQFSHLEICGYKYYYDAMSIVKKQLNNPVFYIFSNSHDDLLWIKDNYEFSGFNVRYVDLSNEDYEELRLMYNCKHFIISNSTFSWWAQYLSKYSNKVVFAPSIWNRDQSIDCSDIYMENWNLINV